jgi:hypothetical protein
MISTTTLRIETNYDTPAPCYPQNLWISLDAYPCDP